MKARILRTFVLLAACTLFTACGSSGIGFWGIVILVALSVLFFVCGGGLAGWRVDYRYGRQKKALIEILHFYWCWTDRLATKLAQKGGKYLEPVSTDKFTIYTFTFGAVGLILVFIGGLIQGGAVVVILGLIFCALCGVFGETTGRVMSEDEHIEVQNMTYGEFIVYVIADSLAATIGLPFILLTLIGQNLNGNQSENPIENPSDVPSNEAETKTEGGSEKAPEPNKMPNYTINYRYPSGSAMVQQQCSMYSEKVPTASEALSYIKSMNWGENYDRMTIVCIRFGTGHSSWVDETHPDNLLNK